LLFLALAFATGCERGPTVSSEILASSEARAIGARLFADDCVICHGNSGDGQGVRRAGFDSRPPDFRSRVWRDRTSPHRLVEVIRNGKKPSSMPAWPGLTDEEVEGLVAYIWSLSETASQ
jgi:high-affinity iron transporter